MDRHDLFSMGGDDEKEYAKQAQKLGLDISQWGPQAWKFMHAITFAYPDKPTPEDKKAVIDFFTSLTQLLPCSKCRNHFKIGLEVKPIQQFVGSRADLSRWLVDFHNAVNVRLGKGFVEYEDMCKIYLGKDLKSASTEETRKCATTALGIKDQKVQKSSSFLDPETSLISVEKPPVEKLASGNGYAVCPVQGHGNTEEAARSGFDEMERQKEQFFYKKGESRTKKILLPIIFTLFCILVAIMIGGIVMAVRYHLKDGKIGKGRIPATTPQ